MLKALSFACALLLLLRFLFGSANHLWAEAQGFVKDSNNPTAAAATKCPAPWLFVWHLFCLISYFFLLMVICYAADTWQFLIRCFIFSATAALLAVLGLPVERKSHFDLTWFWVWTNVGQAIAALLLSLLPESCPPSEFKLLVLALLFLGLLLWDVREQIIKLEAVCRP